MLCIPIIGPTLTEAKEQIQQAQDLADIVELRLDYFKPLKIDEINKLMGSFSIPMILTLRDGTQGGNYRGSEEERLKLLKQLIELKPAYLDIESHVPTGIITEISKISPKTKLIVSYHDFEKTLLNLDEIYQTMQCKEATFYKMAFKCDSSLDALRLLEFKRKADEKLITIGMGPEGEITRILGPVIGNAITYAALEQSQATAPGQIDARTLLETYNYRQLNKNTAIYGLIGSPLKSFGHILHNALIKEEKVNAVYVRIQIEPNELDEFFKYASVLGLKGLSVTIPHKEKVMEVIDHIDDKAKEIGAVNTIIFQNGLKEGFNTDGTGAMDAIENKLKVKGKTVVILGAGGTAKAIAYVAYERGAKIVVLNRTIEKAKELAETFNGIGDSLENFEKYSDCDVLINTTPIELPIDPESIKSHMLIMDVSNIPVRTELLQEAINKGCQVVYGYEMWIEQAIGQYKVWYGEKVNLQEARKVFSRLYSL
jgi:3-dehydroquinate dehydratase / shikimate dehydrogenase